MKDKLKNLRIEYKKNDCAHCKFVMYYDDFLLFNSDNKASDEKNLAFLLMP